VGAPGGDESKFCASTEHVGGMRSVPSADEAAPESFGDRPRSSRGGGAGEPRGITEPLKPRAHEVAAIDAADTRTSRTRHIFAGSNPAP
jgi:hypothetical protein